MRRRGGKTLLVGARESLHEGMTLLAAAVEPTLGPLGRLVAIERETNPRTKAPDLLNDGATIARRIWALPDRWQTMGLLMARHAAAQVEEAVGNGGSTTIVLAHAIMTEGLRHIAAGCDPMRLRRGLERALPVALQAIERTARPLQDDQHILSLAGAITGRDDLARLIHECFDVVGPHGVIEVRPGHGVAHDREYIQGVLWNEGWKSSHFVTQGGAAVLERPYILFATHRLTKAAQLAPLMSALIEANEARNEQRGLVVIAFAIESDALNILVTNKVRGVLPALAIHAPGAGNDRFEILNDLATLCGGKLFAEEAGDRVESARLADLGQADEVNAIRSAFTITGGKGRPAAIRQRIAEIRRSLAHATGNAERDRLTERIGKLLGGVALLRVGGATEAERSHLMQRAEEAVRTIRIGMEGGLVAGGGAAFLAAVPALQQLELEGDEARASAMLRHALLVPMSALIRNAGYEPAPVIHEVTARGTGFGFDVRAGAVVDMWAANIVDPLRLVTTALRAATSCAAMALTTEALVHKPRSVRDDGVMLNP
ncbi:MAG: 60 kDa chaperonin [Candidatus Roseilinea sp.]|nr:MAG: 60 kDa chaperonin [Candidatus Roseilinea sp.]